MDRQFLSSIDEWDRLTPLSVVGPTGSGKTSLVLQFLRNHTELVRKVCLVSVDSVAFYEGLDIGSAKVSGADRADFSWHGLDFLQPIEVATARAFLGQVEDVIAEALESGRPVILVGGSGFYERALVEGVSPGEASDPHFQSLLEGESNEALHRRLLSFDPRWGEKIFPNDRYRTTRYLDLVERQGLSWEELNGEKIRHSRLKQLWTRTQTLILAEDTPKEDFRLPLKQRIEQMFQDGWLEETQNLVESYGFEAPALQSMGYRELLPHMRGDYSLEKAQELILLSHLYYVKKQKTWFRSLRK